EVMRALREMPIQAVGANCSVGSSVLYDILEQMLPEAGGLHVAIQPNAGLPSRGGERLMYLSSPAYMAEYAARMLGSGAGLVGGWGGRGGGGGGGTRPQHIRARGEALDRVAPRGDAAGAEPVRRARLEPAEPSGLTTTAPPTLLQRRLEAGEFVVTVELDPPR